jgi:hypothetical protein
MKPSGKGFVEQCLQETGEEQVVSNVVDTEQCRQEQQRQIQEKMGNLETY